MTFPQALEVVISLVLVYYILGLVVSAFTQVTMDSLETRSAALERYLKKVFGDKAIDVLTLPQIRSLQPIKYSSWTGIIGASTEAKRVEKIPVPFLVNAFLDQAGLTKAKEMSAEELTACAQALPDSEGKYALLAWVEMGITGFDELQERATEYFTGIVEQAEESFAAISRSMMVTFAMLITLLTGIDTIQVAQEFWKNAGLRAVAVAGSNIVVENPNGNGGKAPVTVDLTQLNLKIGWLANDWPSNGSFGDWIVFIFLKIIGLIITAACTSQGSEFWYRLLKKLD